MPDVFQFIDDIDADKQTMIAERLETRAQMAQFAAIRERYFDVIGMPNSGLIHEIGCGTGAISRAVASRPGFTGEVVGSDLSATLIEKAKKITATAGLGNVRFHQADGQGSDALRNSYDVVFAHTVISHVTDPKSLLSEAIRLTKPGGKIIIHDGDYASMTFSTDQAVLDQRLPDLILQAVVANRRIMRELPRLLKECGVQVTHAIGDVVIETGQGDYFPNVARNFCPLAVDAGLAKQQDVDAWLAAIDRALAEDVFFGSCNFVSFGASKPI